MAVYTPPERRTSANVRPVPNPGDLMMVSVLLRLKASGLLDDYPNFFAYVARGEARPPTSVPLRLNWRLTRESNRQGD